MPDFCSNLFVYVYVMQNSHYKHKPNGTAMSRPYSIHGDEKLINCEKIGWAGPFEGPTCRVGT